MYYSLGYDIHHLAQKRNIYSCRFCTVVAPKVFLQGQCLHVRSVRQVCNVIYCILHCSKNAQKFWDFCLLSFSLNKRASFSSFLGCCFYSTILRILEQYRHIPLSSCFMSLSSKSSYDDGKDGYLDMILC